MYLMRKDIIFVNFLNSLDTELNNLFYNMLFRKFIHNYEINFNSLLSSVTG